jgi:hypothetical protein
VNCTSSSINCDCTYVVHKITVHTLVVYDYTTWTCKIAQLCFTHIFIKEVLFYTVLDEQNMPASVYDATTSKIRTNFDVPSEGY